MAKKKKPQGTAAKSATAAQAYPRRQTNSCSPRSNEATTRRRQDAS